MDSNIENEDPLRLTAIPENVPVKTYERKKSIAASGMVLFMNHDIKDEVANTEEEENEYSSGTWILSELT